MCKSVNPFYAIYGKHYFGSCCVERIMPYYLCCPGIFKGFRQMGFGKDGVTCTAMERVERRLWFNYGNAANK